LKPQGVGRPGWGQEGSILLETVGRWNGMRNSGKVYQKGSNNWIVKKKKKTQSKFF